MPKNKSRLQLEHLRDRRLERQNGHRLLRVIRFHGNRLLLEAGAIADAEGRGDLAFLAGRNVIFLQRRHRATAGSARCGLKVNRRVTLVLVLKDAHRRGIADGRMKLDLSFLPDQFRLRGDAAKNNRD